MVDTYYGILMVPTDYFSVPTMFNKNSSLYINSTFSDIAFLYMPGKSDKQYNAVKLHKALLNAFKNKQRFKVKQTVFVEKVGM